MERAADERLKAGAPAERALLAFGLVLLAASAWLRHLSPLARELASGPVWAEEGGRLWRYDASRRDLRAVALPAGLPSEDVARALRASSVWKRRTLSRPDRLFARLEALALPPGERPLAALPVRTKGKGVVLDEALTARLRERFFEGLGPAAPPKATAEVLNATGKDGLALTATQALRRRGVDVLFYGSESPAEKSRILDRDGDRAAAEQVRRALGADLPILTEITASPKAEATLILGADFQESLLR